MFARPCDAEMAGQFVAAFDGDWPEMYGTAEETSSHYEHCKQQ